MLDAGGGGGVPMKMMSAKDIKVSLESLKTFVGKVDSILGDLEGSPGSQAKVADQRVSPAALTSGNAPFPEAQALHNHYTAVQQELQVLSQQLHGQIEALGIAVKGADVGYENLEEEERQRFHQINTDVAQHAEQNREQQGQRGGGEQQRPSDGATVNR